MADIAMQSACRCFYLGVTFSDLITPSAPLRGIPGAFPKTYGWLHNIAALKTATSNDQRRVQSPSPLPASRLFRRARGNWEHL